METKGTEDPYHPYLRATGFGLAESIETNSLMGSGLEPAFTFGITDGLAQPNKIRGRKGKSYQSDDMIAP